MSKNKVARQSEGGRTLFISYNKDSHLLRKPHQNFIDLESSFLQLDTCHVYRDTMSKMMAYPKKHFLRHRAYFIFHNFLRVYVLGMVHYNYISLMQAYSIYLIYDVLEYGGILHPLDIQRWTCPLLFTKDIPRSASLDQPYCLDLFLSVSW